MNELPDPVFFVDRDLGRKIFPTILRDAGLHVEIHDDHFEDDTTSDPVWLGYVGKKGWIAVTRNKDIRYTEVERDAVMIAGVPLFVLRGKWDHKTFGLGFITNLPGILRFLERHDPPFIANVYLPTKSQPKGRVKTWLSYKEWLRRPEA